MASHQLLLQKRLFILDVWPLTIAEKLSILDVCVGPSYVFASRIEAATEGVLQKILF